MIRVLYVTPQESFNVNGGAEIQIIKTMERINELGEDAKIKLFDMWHDKFENYDIVHIFRPVGFPVESYNIAKFAKDKNAKVVVTPIFYEHPEYLKEQFFSSDQDSFALSSFTKAFFYLRKNIFSKMRQLQYLDPYRHTGELLSVADRVLPNSYEELKYQLETFPDLSESKCSVIPNAVDSQFARGDPTLFAQQYGTQDFILFIGRIERRKNVLRLIRSFTKSELPTNLVILGKQTDREYYMQCQKAANERVIFADPLPHDSALLRSAYKAAKVIALPSYYETPGLVALEGGLAGANVVITNNGGTTEYFGDHAWYVDPISERSIQNALVSAFNSSKTHLLSEHINRSFSWIETAQKTLQVYRDLSFSAPHEVNQDASDTQ